MCGVALVDENEHTNKYIDCSKFLKESSQAETHQKCVIFNEENIYKKLNQHSYCFYFFFVNI